MVLEQGDPANTRRRERPNELLQRWVGQGRGNLVRGYAVAEQIHVPVLKLQHLQARVDAPVVLDGVDVRQPRVHVVIELHEDRALVGFVVAIDLKRTESDRRLTELRVA